MKANYSITIKTKNTSSYDENKYVILMNHIRFQLSILLELNNIIECRIVGD